MITKESFLESRKSIDDAYCKMDALENDLDEYITYVESLEDAIIELDDYLFKGIDITVIKALVEKMKERVKDYDTTRI